MALKDVTAAFGDSKPWIRRGFALVLFMVAGTALAYASDGAGVGSLRPTVMAPLIPVAPEPKLIPVEVWNGADVDGDGEADFVNPTGGECRGHDNFGDGQFGASRDGGSRRHEGVDYTAKVGQTVVAPVSGYVTKIGYAYDNDKRLQFVEITNPALNYVARAFYVSPDVAEGQVVQLGQAIGKAVDLQRRYRGITNHVHLELIRDNRRVDAATVLTVHIEMQPDTGAPPETGRFALASGG